MSAVAVLCSGQGFQNGMMFDLVADAPEAGPVFEAAKLVLGGEDPRELVHKATNDALHADKVGRSCAAPRRWRRGPWWAPKCLTRWGWRATASANWRHGA